MRSPQLIAVSVSVLFTSCAANHHPPASVPLAEATRVPEPAPTPLTPPADGQLVSADSPDVQAAFERYVKTGKAPLIDKKSAGFVQYPYGFSQPTVSCRPLELCDIELAPGEEIAEYICNENEKDVPHLK